MKRKFLLLLSLIFYLTSHISFAQIPKDNSDDFIINILKSQPDWFQNILYNPQEYQVQIVYTQINRDSSNRAHFSTHTFQADEFYFYPASWMKLPLAVFTLEKLNELKLNKNDLLKIDPLFGNHYHEYDDVNAIQPPSFAQMIKEGLLVSNNAIYNPLYDFVTQQRANNRFAELGLKKAVICNRFSISEPNEHRHSNFLTVNSAGKTSTMLYQQIQTFNATQPHCTFPNCQFGEKHFEKNVLTDGPKNFYYNNYIPLTEMDLFMRKLFFPKETHSSWNLTKSDFTFLKKYLALPPRLNVHPVYNEKDFPDSYMKYFLVGGTTERLDPSIRVFDKLGQYFGWTADAAYIVDYSTGVEFFLSAVIYTNSQHIVADNPEEYKSIAQPFFAQLGKVFYDYELHRKKKIEPHISFVSYSMDDNVDIKNEEPKIEKQIVAKQNLMHKTVSKPAASCTLSYHSTTLENSKQKKQTISTTKIVAKKDSTQRKIVTTPSKVAAKKPLKKATTVHHQTVHHTKKKTVTTKTATTQNDKTN